MKLDADRRLTTLDNGIRIATERVAHAYGVSLGLTVDAGSRYELPAEAGIAHLLEHMVFKGTERRTARQIAEEMDAVGGSLDAYTSKETTGYSVYVLPEHLPLALDVLSDMLRHSRMNEDDLELEKSVILEEHKSLEDAPEEWVHDLFSETVWPDHPLGRPVIGTPESVAATTPAQLFQFLATQYTPDRLIFASAGNVAHEDVVAQIARYFGDLPTGNAQLRETTEPPITHLKEVLRNRKLEQTHFCMGGQGLSVQEEDRWAARILNMVLGSGMSSRLFQEIRENRGLCYSIGSEMISMRDSGLWIVSADTSPRHLEAVRDLSWQELRRAAANGLTAEELERAKAQIRAGTLLSLDDVGTRMGRLARALLYHDRLIPLSELVAKLEAITLEDCHRVAQRLFGGDQFAFAAIGPFPRRRVPTRGPRTTVGASA